MKFKKYLKESLSKSQKEINFALEHYPFSDIDIPRSISVTGVELSQVGEDILYNDGDGISNHRYSERDDQKINFVSEIHFSGRYLDLECWVAEDPSRIVTEGIKFKNDLDLDTTREWMTLTRKVLQKSGIAGNEDEAYACYSWDKHSSDFGILYEEVSFLWYLLNYYEE